MRELMVKNNELFGEEKQSRIEAETKLIEQAPKVDKYDIATSMSKITGLKSARALNKKLNELGVQFKQSKEGKSYSNINKEFCKLISNEFGVALKWTPKGSDIIIDLLKEKSYIGRI